MPQQNHRLTRACAELIRLWHERYGVVLRPSNMDDGQFLRYRERVDHFHRADLSDPRAQEEIAREQQSRVFEWHYVAPIPTELWRDVIRHFELFDHRPPEDLGEAARWILESLRSTETTKSPEEGRSRLIVEADTRARLLEQAEEFYADVVADQTSGVGGTNVLLSCSLERYPWDREGHRTTLLRPEVLGLRPVARGERPDDLIDALRQGKLAVESVIGGPTDTIPHPRLRDESGGER